MFFRRRKAMTLLILTMLGYGGFCLWFYLAQIKLILSPSSSTLKYNPQDAGLDYQTITLSVVNEQIHGWWLENANFNDEKHLVILFLHGNSSNIGDYVYRLPSLNQLGLSTLLIDYRGYGLSSEITPNEMSVYEDAETALNHLLSERKVEPNNIILYGHSLGGAIAIELATKYPQLGGIIIESTFTSMKDMINYVLPAKILPVDLILTQKFNSIAKINQIQLPMLIIHGTEDKTVPFEMSKKLHLHHQGDKELEIIAGANHVNIPSVFEARHSSILQQFFAKITSEVYK